MVRSTRRGILGLVALRQSQLPYRVLEAGLGVVDGPFYRRLCEGFSRAKARRFDANGGQPAGMVTLLGRCCGYLCRARAPGENSDRVGLDDGDERVVTFLGASSWSLVSLGLFS